MKIEERFSIIENRDISYLDSGATTQKPIQVINAIEEFYKNIMQIHIEEHMV